MIRTFLIVSILAVASCGGSSKESTTPTGGGDPCAGGDACAGGAAGFAGWDRWTKANDTRFVSKGHMKAWVDVYVEASALDAYTAATGPYPVGARIVKAQYAAEQGGGVTAITVMEKKPAGYDPDNGDWYYGVFDPSGAKAMVEGKVPKCVNCHDQVSERDYVFGLAK